MQTPALGENLCHFGMGFKLPYSFFGLNSNSLNLFSILRSFFPQMNSLCPERVGENWSKADRVRNKEDDGVPLSSMTGCFTGSESLTRSLCLWKKNKKRGIVWVKWNSLLFIEIKCDGLSFVFTRETRFMLSNHVTFFLEPGSFLPPS